MWLQAADDVNVFVSVNASANILVCHSYHCQPTHRTMNNSKEHNLYLPMAAEGTNYDKIRQTTS